jgi:hypothetical protein
MAIPKTIEKHVGNRSEPKNRSTALDPDVPWGYSRFPVGGPLKENPTGRLADIRQIWPGNIAPRCITDESPQAYVPWLQKTLKCQPPCAILPTCLKLEHKPVRRFGKP